MTSEEKYKLICKFMCFEPAMKNYDDDMRYYTIRDTAFDGKYKLKEMKFAISYDWQMLVLMKIRRLGFHYQIGEIGEERARIIIQHPQWEEKINISGNYDLLPTFIFEAIVKFIEWHYETYINKILNEKTKSNNDLLEHKRRSKT